MEAETEAEGSLWVQEQSGILEESYLKTNKQKKYQPNKQKNISPCSQRHSSLDAAQHRKDGDLEVQECEQRLSIWNQSDEGRAEEILNVYNNYSILRHFLVLALNFFFENFIQSMCFSS